MGLNIFKRQKGDFVKRTRFRLTMTNLATQRTVMSVRMRRWGFILLGVLAVVIVGALTCVAIMYTPLRNTLPSRLQAVVRDEYVDMSVRIDSAAHQAAITEAYMDNLISILRDSTDTEVIPAEETQLLELPLDSLLESTEAERAFVSRFEASERYNLSVLAPIAAEGMTFVPPTSGTQAEIKTSDGGIPSAVITGGATLPVSAAYRGTVVNTYYTTGKGITVVVQHPNDFITVYSGLGEIFVTKGDKVKGGTRLGLCTEGRPLTLEMWHNGSPLPPDEYINL